MAPEVQIIWLQCANGFLCDMSFITKQQRNGDDPGWTRAATPEAVDAEIAKASQSFPAEYLPIKAWRYGRLDEFPKDRAYRAAWVDTGAAIEHDMTKAREIHRDRVRQARAPLLAALDVEYQRADEDGDAVAKARVAQEKRALRDATADPAIEAARTIDELRAIALVTPSPRPARGTSAR